MSEPVSHPAIASELKAVETEEIRLLKRLESNFKNGFNAQSDLEKARQELYNAAYFYAITFNDNSDDDRMVSVIARLEVAAERFAQIKQAAIPTLSAPPPAPLPG